MAVRGLAQSPGDPCINCRFAATHTTPHVFPHCVFEGCPSRGSKPDEAYNQSRNQSWMRRKIIMRVGLYPPTHPPGVLLFFWQILEAEIEHSLCRGQRQPNI
jgi:hypothetical protein